MSGFIFRFLYNKNVKLSSILTCPSKSEHYVECIKDMQWFGWHYTGRAMTMMPHKTCSGYRLAPVLYRMYLYRKGSNLCNSPLMAFH